MHSGRMRTVRCSGRLGGGVGECLPEGGASAQGEVSAQGGSQTGGGVKHYLAATTGCGR